MIMLDNKLYCCEGNANLRSAFRKLLRIHERNVMVDQGRMGNPDTFEYFDNECELWAIRDLIKRCPWCSEDKRDINLSILICSVWDRNEKLVRLVNRLKADIEKNDLQKKVEIIVNIDNRKLTIGEKRNQLLGKAKGKFVVFIDDDDIVSEDYCSYVNMIVERNTNYPIDCIGYRASISVDGVELPQVSYYSTRFTGWSQNEQGYYKHLCHKMPIRKDLILMSGILFPSKNFGEDYDWALALEKTAIVNPAREYFIDSVMYFYYFNTDKTYDKNSSKIKIVSQELLEIYITLMTDIGDEDAKENKEYTDSWRNCSRNNWNICSD